MQKHRCNELKKTMQELLVLQTITVTSREKGLFFYTVNCNVCNSLRGYRFTLQPRSKF